MRTFNRMKTTFICFEKQQNTVMVSICMSAIHCHTSSNIHIRLFHFTVVVYIIFYYEQHSHVKIKLSKCQQTAQKFTSIMLKYKYFKRFHKYIVHLWVLFNVNAITTCPR